MCNKPGEPSNSRNTGRSVITGNDLQEKFEPESTMQKPQPSNTSYDNGNSGVNYDYTN